MNAVLEQIPAQTRASAGPVDPYVQVIRKVIGMARGNISVLSTAPVREGRWIEVIIFTENVDRNLALEFSPGLVFSSTVDVSNNGASEEHLAGLVGRIVVDVSLCKPDYSEGNSRNAYLSGTFLLPRMGVPIEEVQAVAAEVIARRRKNAEDRTLARLAEELVRVLNGPLASNLAEGVARLLRPDQLVQLAKDLPAIARASAR